MSPLRIKLRSSTWQAGMIPPGQECWHYLKKLILLLMSFPVTRCLSTWKYWCFSWENVFGPPQKPWLWTNKKKALALLYLASRRLQNAANSSVVPTEFTAGPTTRMKLSKGKFVTWTFRLPPKWQLSILLNFFFPLIELFLTFVVFAKMQVTVWIRAKKAGHSTGLSQLCATWYWWPYGVDGHMLCTWASLLRGLPNAVMGKVLLKPSWIKLHLDLLCSSHN